VEPPRVPFESKAEEALLQFPRPSTEFNKHIKPPPPATDDEDERESSVWRNKRAKLENTIVEKLVSLDSQNISTLVKENQEELKKIHDIDFELDLSKEFRYKNYPVILLIIKNPLKELISSVAPHPEVENSKQDGFLYLYDGKVPNYMNDGIIWRKTRMSVKLIVFNKAKGIYKLKNHKTDSGNAVMRRQTWQSNGWRKNEYKLINRETYYKPESDGSFSVNECQTLQDFPVLVHYFRKNDSIPDIVENGTPSKKRKAKEKEKEIKDIKEKDLNNNNSILNTTPPVTNNSQTNFFASFSSAPVSFLTPSSPSDHGMYVKEELSILSPDMYPGQYPIFVSRSAPIPIATPTASAEVKSYAPDTGPSQETSKVIMVVQGFPQEKEYHFSCMFESIEIPASQIAPGVIEFFTPPHNAGVVHFWISCRETNSKNVLYSNVAPFYYTPSDETGRLSLAFNNFYSDKSTRDMMCKFRHTVRELDLSNNNLSDVDFLAGFYQLHTLVLDNNQITTSAKLPYLPKLLALYINCNMITEAEPFVDKLRQCFPSLQYLSMLGNEACPCFSKAPHIYYNYRIYVCSRLRKLTQLDSSPVTPEEWRHSACLIPGEEESSIKREINLL